MCRPLASAVRTMFRANTSSDDAPAKIPGIVTKIASALRDFCGPAGSRKRR